MFDRPTRLLLLCTLALLAGCDLLGIEPAAAVAARKEAEGKAVGGACRHAGRAIEDCYALNRKADKAAVFAGWREMNDYMRENKIDTVAPTLDKTGEPVTAQAADDDHAEAPGDHPKDDGADARKAPAKGKPEGKAAARTEDKSESRAQNKSKAKPSVKGDHGDVATDKPARAARS